MQREQVKASDVKSGDRIVYNMGIAGHVIAGVVDKAYPMVENRVQFRLLPGGRYSAVTFGRDDMVGIA